MDSLIKKKMFDLEVPPPAATWEKLSARLDEWEHDKTVVSKMEDYAVAPPALAWENIAQQLEPAPEKATGTLRTLPLRRWLAAASLIGLLLVSAYWLLRKNDAASIAEPVALETGTRTPATQTPNPEPTTQNPVEENTMTGTSDAPGLIAGLNNNLVRKTKRIPAAVTTTTVSEDRRVNAGEKVHHQNAGTQLGLLAVSSMSNKNDRYYNLLDENGNLVRVSKKLSALDCVIKNGKVVPLDENKQTTDESCIEKVKEWHKIMSTAPVIVSPLDLLQVLATGG